MDSLVGTLTAMKSYKELCGDTDSNEELGGESDSCGQLGGDTQGHEELCKKLKPWTDLWRN